jgi:hypothetical protein
MICFVKPYTSFSRASTAIAGCLNILHLGDYIVSHEKLADAKPRICSTVPPAMTNRTKLTEIKGGVESARQPVNLRKS